MNTPGAIISARYAGMLGSFRLDAAFEVPMRGITALFGPSGCGKTTILRCVAGLNRMPGCLVVGGETWQDHATGKFREPYHRPIGYVFQEASLFAHLSVRRNLLYGHRRALSSGAAEKIRFDDVVDLLGIGPLLGRATVGLSGGERQRVALGRALLAQPELLLMDEPLSALDRMTKEEILPYLEALRASLSLPVLYVSHDLSEIERLADYMVLLAGGRVLAAGPLGDLLYDSRLPIGRRREASSVLEAEIGAFDPEDALTTIKVNGAKLLVPGRIGEQGAIRRIRIAATDVSLAVDYPSRTTIMNILPVRVNEIEPIDSSQINVLVTVGECGGGPKLLARVTRRSAQLLGFRPGQSIYAQIKAVSLLATPEQRPNIQSSSSEIRRKSMTRES